MSAVGPAGETRAATRAVTASPALPAPGTRLRLVPAPGARASSGAYVVLLAMLLAAGLLGLLAVTTVLAQGSFATSDLTRKQDALAQREQALQQEVARLQSPQQLAAAATALGMVGTHNPVFIDTRTRRVLGVPQAAPRRASAATASPSPTPTGPATSATAQPTAKPTAKPTPKPTAKPTAKPTPTPTGAR
jgi:cell division protein FtsB